MTRVVAIADPGVAEAVLALQRAAYQVEAELLGVTDFEPLHDTAEDLLASGETFLAEQDLAPGEQGLRGVLGYTASGGHVDICRLMVAPGHFRRGVATRLLDALEAREAGWHRLTVSTGAENTPAVRLYRGRGFEPVRVKPIRPGLRVLQLEKRR